MKALKYDTNHNLMFSNPELEELPEDATVASQTAGDMGVS